MWTIPRTHLALTIESEGCHAAPNAGWGSESVGNCMSLAAWGYTSSLKPCTPCCAAAEPWNHKRLRKDLQFFREAEKPHHCPFTYREMVHKEAK